MQHDIPVETLGAMGEAMAPRGRILRALWLLPARLPHVLCIGRGDGFAPRPDYIDEIRSRRRCRSGRCLALY